MKRFHSDECWIAETEPTGRTIRNRFAELKTLILETAVMIRISTARRPIPEFGLRRNEARNRERNAFGEVSEPEIVNAIIVAIQRTCFS